MYPTYLPPHSDRPARALPCRQRRGWGDDPAPGPSPDPGGDPSDPEDELFLPYCLLACFLVSRAGLMSGLTLGLMSLDQVDIEVRAGGEVARVGSGGRRLQMQGCGGRQRQRQLPVFAVSGASAMQFQ